MIVLGHDHGWFYGDGFLVYQLGDMVRILDVYNAAVTEDVIDLRSLLSEESERWNPHTQGIRELLSRDLELDIVWMDYKEGLLLISMKHFHSNSLYLVVINIRKGIPLQERLLMIRWCSGNVVAKTDGRCIIVLDDSERSGNLDLYDLEDKQQRIRKLYLPGCTNLFMEDYQIYDGWFYLLGRDNHHIYCYSFPLKQSRPVGTYVVDAPEQLQILRVKRRQPRARQNCWPSLKLRRNEYSGQLVIIEGSLYGEKDGASNPQYAFQSLQIPEQNSAIYTATPACKNDFHKFVQILNPAALRRAEKDCECPSDPGDRIIARSYVPKVSTYFDVYLGSNANPDSAKGFEFRLAVGSCHRAAQSESEFGQLEKVSSEKLGGASPDDDNERQSVRVRRFPPNGAPKALSDLLCPTGRLNGPKISPDDPRSILYSTKRLHRRLNDTADQLLLINFDPWIRFPRLEPMVLHPPTTELTAKEYENELIRAKKDKIFISGEEYEAKAEKRAAKQAKIDEMNKAEKAGKVWKPKSEWFWNERAMYLDIGQGFQFS